MAFQRLCVVSVLGCAAAHQCDAKAVDICACIEAAPHDSHGLREGAFGMSVVVPFHAWMTFHDGVDSSDVEWRNGRTALFLGRHFERNLEKFDTPETDECLVRVDGRRVLMSEGQRGQDHYVVADFETREAYQGRSLSVHAPSVQKACLLAARVVWSVKLNHGHEPARDLTILGISHDRKSFRYEITPGSVVQARLGDLLLGEHGKVKAITSSSVTVAEWISDGRGGWSTVERLLPLRSQDVSRGP